MQVLDFYLSLEASWFSEDHSSSWDLEEPAAFSHEVWEPTVEAMLSSGAVRDFLIAHPGMEAGA